MEDQGTLNSFSKNIETMVTFNPCNQLHLVEKVSILSYLFIFVITDERAMIFFILPSYQSNINQPLLQFCFTLPSLVR